MSGRKNTDDETPKKTKKRMNNNYPCRYRMLMRMCHAEGLTATELFKKCRLSDDDKRNLRTGKPVKPSIYLAFAEVLNCEPTSLYYADEYPIVHSLPTRAYASRVEQLLDENVIPEFDENGEPTDVIEYVWQLGDPILNGISLTHQQERDAYLILRDEYQRVIERPIHTGPRRNQLGKFHIAVVWHEDIVSDIKVRLALANSAYDTLQEQYNKSNYINLERIRDELPGRFRRYKACVAENAKQDEPDTSLVDDLISSVFELNGKQHQEKHEYAVAIRRHLNEVCSQAVDQQAIDKVIDADYFCRKIIFPTAQQDQIFAQCYSRSRALIMLNKKKLSSEDFSAWWTDWRFKNTNYLEMFCDGWTQSPPKWEEIRESTKLLVDDLIEEVEATYPSICETDTSMPQRAKLAQSSEGKG